MRDDPVPLSILGASTLVFHGKSGDRSIDLNKVERILCERQLCRNGVKYKLHFYQANIEQDTWLFYLDDKAGLSVIAQKIAAINPSICIDERINRGLFSLSWWWPEA